MTDHCAGCALTRRAFVQDGFLFVAGAFLLPRGLPLTPLARRGGSDREHNYPVPTADGVQIDRDNQVILVRYQNHVYAFNLSCPHQHTALRWRDEDQQFQCPKHHSKYQPDGTFISGRATRSMDRYGVRKDGDAVVVDLDVLYHDDKDHTGWTAAVVDL